MSLLSELQSLDLSGIIDARASISLAVQDPQLQAVLSGGAAQTALAGLGSSLQAMRGNFDNPAALLSPLLDAVGALAGEIDPGDLPIAAYLEAVRAGATLVAQFFAGVDRDPLALGNNMGFSLTGAFDAVQELVANNTRVDFNALGQYRQLIEVVERGVPSDPQALGHLALDILLPFPRSSVEALRGGVSAVFDGVAQIHLPAGRTAGLMSALEAVATTATAGDAQALDRALAELERVRSNTTASIRDDVLAAIARIDQLRLDQALEPIATAGDSLRFTAEGVLESLEEWRAMIARFRGQIDAFDASELVARLPELLDLVDAFARDTLVAPIDAQVARLQEWVRSLLAELRLRVYRRQITDFILGIAQTIRTADLDRYAETARAALRDVQNALDPANLTAEVQQALAAVKAVIDGALSSVFEALNSIKAAIEGVAGTAEDILNRAAQAVTSFRVAIDEVTAAIDGLGVEEITQQIVDTLRQLRETAEELLSVAPLPEPLRPVVEQIVEELRGADFDVVFKPVRSAVEELDIPDEVAATLRDALRSVKDVLDNLIPRELIDAIEAEINEALEVLRGFDPSTLLDGVTQYIEQAARFIEGLNPEPLAAEIRGPYQAVLDTVDRVHPNRLLAPVIEVYDSVLGRISIPAPVDAARRLSEVINSAGEGVAGALTQPLTQLAPAGSVTTPDAQPPAAAEPGTSVSGAAPAPASPSTPPDILSELATFRPGDIVRVFAFLPDRLRQVLAEMDAGPAGDTLRIIDSYTGGLARDLREVQTHVWQIEAQLDAWLDHELAPLGRSQLRAQLAIRAHFSAGGVDVNAKMAAVAQSGPAAMRASLGACTTLARERAQRAAAAGSRYSDALERAASALERCRLARLVGDLDAFLAALDPEPLAAEIDALMAAIINKTPDLLNQFGEAVRLAIRRLTALLEEVNPVAQAEKFARVLDVVREELDLLNPRRLADELGEVHAAIREVIAAYDPAVFARELNEIVQRLAAGLRALNPAALLGDLALFDDLADRIEAVMPTQALEGVGESLRDVGNQLAELDPGALLEAIERLGPRVVDAFEQAVEAIRQEIVALLESLRYASGGASASASVEVG